MTRSGGALCGHIAAAALSAAGIAAAPPSAPARIRHLMN
jgi:hypothetical protein